ncbi:restriction endonuclease subunit S [Aliiroseovarius sp. Z3]|uniref:restriction endonuclease subunit S n=1 Tax=Aliiroseovarius sp. Z3 TaxID=2811402 RepID=UPI0023B32503|nr:restriction endonuclease subunit S [Aliiroseovarius sp. Z3]MDE9451016.1 restriction endonuclease subunit S [Aliiroseovarius sp. Z3]
MSYAPYPAYKDSGIPWLGQVPEGWEVKPIKYVSTFNDEALPEATDPELMLNYVDISSVSLVEGIKKIEQVEFEKAPSRARRVVREGDTIVSTVRTYLKAIAPIRNPVDNMIVSTGFAVIRPDQTMNPDFLGYFIQSEGFVGEVVSKSTGVSYPAINPGDLVAISGVRPPFKEQTAIADFLDEKTAEIDDLIAKKEELLRLLAEQRTALITHAVTKGLNPNAPMKPSGVVWFDQVPAHWQVRRLKDVGTLTGGTGFPHEFQNVQGEELYFYKVGDLAKSEDGIHLTSAPHTIGRETAAKLRATVIPPDAILYAKIGAALLLNRRRISTANCCIDNNMTAWIVDPSKVLPLWGFYWMSTVDFGEHTNPGAVPSLSEGYQSILPITLPPLDEQQAIVGQLTNETKAIDQTAQKTREAIEHLREYRTALIANAVTGKIKVA